MSERIKNVEYEFFENHKTGLCVVFPPAGETESIQTFINLLSDEFGVMCIKGGYYGISPLKNSEDTELYKFGEASNTVANLISNMDYSSLTIIGGSVGALHAMELKRLMGGVKQNMVLFAPALYKRGLITPINNALLKRAFKGENFFQSKLLVETLKRFKREKLLEAMQRVAEKVGPMSYLMCLKDIVDYTKDPNKIKTLLKNSLIVVGKEDLLFKHLCDPGLCQEGEVVYVDSNHSPMKEIPEESFRLVRGFVNRKRY